MEAGEMNGREQAAMNEHNDVAEAVEALSSAKVELYRAEMALHDARLTNVDRWIKAASDHLQRACSEYERLLGHAVAS
jgi:hypothetical protein